MKIILLSTAAIAALFTTSCNTFIGMGRDLRLLGEGIENTAHGSGKKKTDNPPAESGAAPIY
ncbi:MAG: hypothetical protein R3242_04850 [Akkermansiaceae bacterium]|nr:hypothetical protein [Akkermansiaceae bacterium]